MLEVRHISYSWGRTSLFEDVSMSVAPGETVVLAGANGSGKTTLMRIIAGLCQPTAGSVLADDGDVFLHPLRFRRMLGYLPETAPAEPDMRVREYLRYRAWLRGEMAKKIRHRVAESMELCGLQTVGGERVGSLSFGMRKRVALADALLLRPRFLLLDDLLAGLDPETRLAFGRILKAISSFASVLVSGHELDELAQWATKFYILRNGRMMGAKTVGGVKAVLGLSAPARDGGPVA